MREAAGLSQWPKGTWPGALLFFVFCFEGGKSESHAHLWRPGNFVVFFHAVKRKPSRASRSCRRIPNVSLSMVEYGLLQMAIFRVSQADLHVKVGMEQGSHFPHP